MDKKDLITRTLVIIGTVLTWFPMLLPVIFSGSHLLRAQIFRFDYLMPAEIFPVVLVGAALLLWGARRAHMRIALVGGGFALTLVSLALALVLAQVTGMASGAIEPVGWPFALVAGCFVLFWIGMLAMGVGGVLLWRDLANKQRATPVTPA
jgi:hypothetical protein